MLTLKAPEYIYIYNIHIYVPYAFCFIYCQIKDKFLIKATLGSKALITRRPKSYLRADTYGRKRGKAEDAQYS